MTRAPLSTRQCSTIPKRLRSAIPTLVILHGWGFTPDIWHPVVEHLPNWRIHLWDRGYFGPECMADIGEPHLAVGHSFGAMLLARMLPHVPLVAINGFDRLCGPDGLSRRVAQHMRRRFEQTPDAVLATFRERCGASPVHHTRAGTLANKSLGAQRLATDLNHMIMTHGPLSRSAPVLALHGGNDAILPAHLRQNAFPGARRIELPDQGHLLPLTMPQWCAAHIRAFVS